MDRQRLCRLLQVLPYKSTGRFRPKFLGQLFAMEIQASTCASAASRNGIRRPIGRTNLPSRTSSANSRTLDGSGCASTHVILTVDSRQHAIAVGWSANLSSPDYGRVARHSEVLRRKNMNQIVL